MTKSTAFQNKGMDHQSLNSDQLKYEIAKEHHIPLKKGDNGNLTAKQAGTVGGHIGGPMVHELIKRAKQQLSTSNKTD
ncbi:alpha/beta-type small acid-soluble spore protein [Pullulanibacillus sp. KACC 23026]|uniref:alpha/beta-type small acid-soluble spore protein n=1 Tax=Pullulanibacillus sp. KACC 23026 TaxID=3028315 RepID=UPI0023B11372|nr:alpha/beta-type small acid-soluble spore protein [Pullulanibacillus sp. KACC 23026]WEG11784.1 alpha/beta-type small acid-soluble spore protein [Pullulanibacillus sp. KACC 23026]